MGCSCSGDSGGLDPKTLARYHEQALKRWQLRQQEAERAEDLRAEQQRAREQQLREAAGRANMALLAQRGSQSEYLPAQFDGVGGPSLAPRGSAVSTMSDIDDSGNRRDTLLMGFVPLSQLSQQLPLRGVAKGEPHRSQPILAPRDPKAGPSPSLSSSSSESTSSQKRSGSPLLAFSRNNQVLQRGHIGSHNSPASSAQFRASAMTGSNEDHHQTTHDDFIRSVLHAKGSLDDDPRETDFDGEEQAGDVAESPRNNRANPLSLVDE